MSNLSKIPPAALSRRSMLQRLAWGAGGAALLGTAAGTSRVEAAQTKVAQKVVAYQDMPKGPQRCDNCVQFETPASCKVVDGAIDPAGWCKVYIKKPA